MAVFNQAGVPGMLSARDALADGYTITFGTSGILAVTPNFPDIRTQHSRY